MIVQGLWYRQTEAITDVKLGDDDVDSYEYDPMAELLSWWIIINTDKHGKHSQDQRKYFPTVCFFCRWEVREGSFVRNCAIDSNHVRKNGQTNFSRTGVDKWSNYNHSCKILLTYDSRSSILQSPAGQGAGLGSGIGNRVGRLNHAHN